MSLTATLAPVIQRRWQCLLESSYHRVKKAKITLYKLKIYKSTIQRYPGAFDRWVFFFLCSWEEVEVRRCTLFSVFIVVLCSLSISTRELNPVTVVVPEMSAREGV